MLQKGLVLASLCRGPFRKRPGCSFFFLPFRSPRLALAINLRLMCTYIYIHICTYTRAFTRREIPCTWQPLRRVFRIYYYFERTDSRNCDVCRVATLAMSRWKIPLVESRIESRILRVFPALSTLLTFSSKRFRIENGFNRTVSPDSVYPSVNIFSR